MGIEDSIDKSSFFALDVSEDKFVVLLTVHPFKPHGVYLSYKDVLAAISDMNISYGINKHAIKTTLKEVCVAKVTVGNVAVVNGVRPVDGEDGWVEFLFDTEKKGRPDTSEDGHLDFRNIHTVEKVVNGQQLAKLIPPTDGTPGRNVFGEEIACKAGKECSGLPVGNGCKVADSDKNLLIAAMDGNVSYDGSIVTVNEEFTVEGDIDYSVGNVSYSGDVIIKGDIKSGFEVKSDGSITITGSVGDAKITAGGDVDIEGGFVGVGSGRIEAKGDVTIGFARNQMIIGKNIEFVKEAIDCISYAKETIVASSGRLSVVGGLLAAGTLIDIAVLGSKAEVHMEVEAGVDYAAHKGLMNIKRKINTIKTAMVNIKREIVTLETFRDSGDEFTSQHRAALNKFTKQQNEFGVQLADLQSREESVAKNIKVDKSANIVIHEAVFPGVTIKIGDISLDVLDEYKGVTFYLADDVIATK